MITLHSMVTYNDLLWPNLPCQSNYHAGYPSERTQFETHHGCLQPRINQTTTWFCECRTCRDTANPHYFWEQPVYIHDRYQCKYCADGHHPVRQ